MNPIGAFVVLALAACCGATDGADPAPDFSTSPVAVNSGENVAIEFALGEETVAPAPS